MEKSMIKTGGQYAIREPVAEGVDFQHVKVLENVRGSRWKVQWIDPNPGLIDYVTSRNVIVEWSQRKAFLTDERRAAALADHLERSGFKGEDHPEARAISEVLDAAGEPELFSGAENSTMSPARSNDSHVALGSRHPPTQSATGTGMAGITSPTSARWSWPSNSPNASPQPCLRQST